jgi:DNA-binding LacI/PurR family transcriptional regulator
MAKTTHKPDPTLTMDEIARLAGVSKPTVSRVMSGSSLVSQKTRDHVLKVARQHGYTVNQNARRLRQMRANTIAVVMDLPSLPGERVSLPFHFELLADVFKGLQGLKQDVLLHSPEGESAATYETMVASLAADGIIFLGQGTRLSTLRALAKTTTPFVAWGTPDPEADYCAIGSDNRLGGALAGKRLAALGRGKILFVGRLEHGEMHERRRGLEEGLRADGSPYAIVDIEPADLSYEASLRAVAQYLAETGVPDGIFCASDTMAMATMAALLDRGLRIPRDVSVIGYDDIPQAAQHRPSLTSIRQDTRLAGTTLVEKLMERIAGRAAASETLPTELIIRES